MSNNKWDTKWMFESDTRRFPQGYGTLHMDPAYEGPFPATPTAAPTMPSEPEPRNERKETFLDAVDIAKRIRSEDRWSADSLFAIQTVIEALLEEAEKK